MASPRRIGTSAWLDPASPAHSSFPPTPPFILTAVFVTGNANKLKEVKAILLAGSAGGEGASGAKNLEIDSKALDRGSSITRTQGSESDSGLSLS